MFLRLIFKNKNKMSITKKDYSSYQFVINELNKLQIMTPQQQKNSTNNDLRKLRIESTKNLCKRLDIKIEDIDRLNIIHISGTKGKGSTSAFTESILRKHGYKTGLYSSPHLIEVRERIKINGESLSYKLFTEYFLHCHELLIQDAIYECDSQKPIYFQFLTCMMFYVFLKEKIDVAIIEVGIGGEYDATNIIKKPVACGITSLGYDHCSILGNTIEEIAWQKAGIFKNDSIGFTCDNQLPNALQILKNRANEKNIPLCVVKPLDKTLEISLNGNIQYSNAALAVALSSYWIYKKQQQNNNDWITKQTYIDENDIRVTKSVDLNENYLNGLKSCKWPGRNQILKSSPLITYYIDGAHTLESIKQFIDWFNSIEKRKNSKNVLLFNFTGDRNGNLFLKELLKSIDFDSIAFSKLIAYPSLNDDDSSDTIKVVQKEEEKEEDKVKYDQMINSLNEAKNNNIDYKIFSNISDSLKWLTTRNREEEINVLITGSLYLVGLSLKLLDHKID